MKRLKQLQMLLTSKSSLPHMLLVLLLLFHLLANIWWLAADNHAIETDEEGHMISARDYYSALFPFEGPRDLKSRLAAVSRIELGNPAHPPLLHILAAVAIRLLGYSTNVMAFTMTPLFLLALVGCWQITRLYLNDWEALFCVCVVSLTPMVYAASRYLMTDYLSMVIVVWAMYALLRSDQFMKMRWAALFGLLNGLGILTRPTTFIYLLAPAALAVGIGLCRAMMDSGKRSPHIYRILRNSILVLVISVAVFGPWYAWHHERFFGFWLTNHEGGPMALMRYEQEEATTPLPVQPRSRPSENTASRAPSTAVSPRPAAPVPEIPAWRLNLNPFIPWMRYPVLVINNGTFLVTFLLGIAGMVVLCCFRRFRRSGPLWQLLVWIIGAYLLMTMLMRFANARYALQFIPPIAMFSALPFFLIRHAGARNVAQACYIALLLFQYGNLTFFDYGPLGSLKIPWMPDERMQREYDDHGLYIFKPRLTLSIAYSRVSAPVQENFKDRIFTTMMRNEKAHLYTGTEAAYIRLNIRGMLLEEQHFWPDLEGQPNPFRRRDIPPESFPRRRFRHYGWGRKVEEIIPSLGVAHYITYTTEGILQEEEARWLRIFERHGYELIDRFYQERYGRVPGRYFGVLARPPTWRPVQITSREDIAALDLDDLYQYRYSDAFEKLSPALQSSIDTRIRALFSSTGQRYAIHDGLSFLGMTITHVRAQRYEATLLFRATERLPSDGIVFFRGLAAPEHRNALPEEIRDTGAVDWPFEPLLNTRFWYAREYVLVRHSFSAPPVPLLLHVGLYARQKGILGHVVNFGIVDFEEIAAQPE